MFFFHSLKSNYIISHFIVKPKKKLKFLALKTKTVVGYLVLQKVGPKKPPLSLAGFSIKQIPKPPTIQICVREYL